MAHSKDNVQNRQYFDASGPYLLPNDSQEHERLDGQSQSLIALMGGNPFHAPLSKPKRILDIGCGTGAMTYLLARMYPNAHVIGIDMSAVPDGRFDKLDNLEYVQANIFDLVRDGKDPRFQGGSFDYVFERLLMFGITRWPQHISNVATLLKPGGWLEVQEPSGNIIKADGSSSSEEWWYYGNWRADTAATGLDIEIGPKLSNMLKTAGGLSDVQETIYKFPPMSTPDRPELDGLGDNVPPMLSGVMRKACEPSRSAEEVEQMAAEMQSHFKAGSGEVGHVWEETS